MRLARSLLVPFIFVVRVPRAARLRNAWWRRLSREQATLRDARTAQPLEEMEIPGYLEFVDFAFADPYAATGVSRQFQLRLH
eukprot:5021352-Prymnesium_polylepis.1